MTTLALLLVAAALAHFLSSSLRVSAIPLFILAGIGLTVSGLVPEDEQLNHTLLLGLTFLVFIAGTELNPDRIGGQFRAALLVGILQFFVLGFISFAVAYAGGLGLVAALYLGLAIAASSTLLVVRLLQRRRQFFEPFGRLVLGVLLVQDIIVIIFISLLSAGDFDFENILRGGVGVTCLATLSLLFQKKIAPYLFISLKLDEETLLLLSLALLFFFAFLANILGMPFVVGAFFAGIALSSFPIHGIVQSQLLSLSDFFIAIFFVSLGTTLVVPSGSALWLAGMMAALVVLITPIVVVLAAERAGLTTRGALEAGLLLAQTSEFSLVVGIVGFEAGHIDKQLLSVIALVTVTTMILTPLLATDRVTWKLTRLRPYRFFSQVSRIPDNHILMLGCGQSGISLLSQLDPETKKKIVVVDNDPAVLWRLGEKGIAVVRGDAADFRVLDACNAKQATLIVSTLAKIKDNEGVLRHLRGTKVIVRVVEEHEARQVRELGGIAVLASELAAESLLRWMHTEGFTANPGAVDSKVEEAATSV